MTLRGLWPLSGALDTLSTGGGSLCLWPLLRFGGDLVGVGIKEALRIAPEGLGVGLVVYASGLSYLGVHLSFPSFPH